MSRQSRALLSLLAVCYLVQAYTSNPGLAALPIVLHLKEILGLDAAQVASFQAIAFLPWYAKPLFGLLTDGVSLWGYRVKSYLLLCYALAAVLLLGAGLTGISSFTGLLAIALLVSISIAFSDVLADKWMVVRGKAAGNTALLQATQWTAAGLGGASAYYLGGILAQDGQLSLAIGLSAIAPLLGLVAVPLWLREERDHQPARNLRASLGALWRAAQTRRFLGVAIFLVLLEICPTPPAIFYQRDTLGFETDFIGALAAVQFVGMGGGALLFGGWARHLRRGWLLNVIVACSALATLSLAAMTDARSAMLIYFLSVSPTSSRAWVCWS
ncbi:MAG: folate/biopterin family MFS transporter [Spirulinaceae cyanobacterium SM2_1_0]|nr:folate/biopterin family MFS transporter [Spirulinaceae cyanobacterium SM2_1_0]